MVQQQLNEKRKIFVKNIYWFWFWYNTRDTSEQKNLFLAFEKSLLELHKREKRKEKKEIWKNEKKKYAEKWKSRAKL